MEEFYFSQNQFTNFTKPADKLILNIKSYNPASIEWDGLDNIINGVSMAASDVDITAASRPSDTTAPAVATGLTTVSDSGNALLYWDIATERDLAEYRIYRSSSSGGPYTQIGSESISYFEDTDISSGTTYYYVVTVLDMAGNESGDSIEVSADGSTTNLFIPTDDTYSKENDVAANFGGAVEMQVRSNATKEKNAYLKFNVADVFGSIQSATLKVHIGANPIDNLTLHTATNTSWDEMTLTWTNAPAIGGSLGTVSGATADSWIEWDITSTITGNGLYSFALKSTVDLAHRNIGTKESTTYAPELEVVHLTGYAGWITGYLSGSPDADRDYDYDGDGLVNLGEYGLGGNPTNAGDNGTSPTIEVAEHNGSNCVFFVHSQLSDPASGLKYYLEQENNLIDAPGWTNCACSVSGTNVTGGDLNYVTNIIPIGDVMQQFFRLQIED